MNRREALSTSALLVGGTLLGTEWLIRCAPDSATGAWTPSVIKLLDEVGETILPATANSPGAKEAGIGEFMKVMVTECFDDLHQTVFQDGIRSLEERCKKEFAKGFGELSFDERTSLLTKLDREAIEFNQERADGAPRHYFSLMKGLAMNGYFSSEPGATKALRYVPIPGRYEGCVTYKSGDPAWAAE